MKRNNKTNEYVEVGTMKDNTKFYVLCVCEDW
jgi:hypothetical protein